MSSQQQGISLCNAPDDTVYRLIELPAELQALLESDDAPVLTLESSDTSALLKTPAKTYVLRQKNTSNALILLKPYAAESSLEQGLAAISTSHETVELDIARTQNLPAEAAKAPTSKGKWHERFGRNR